MAHVVCAFARFCFHALSEKRSHGKLKAQPSLLGSFSGSYFYKTRSVLRNYRYAPSRQALQFRSAQSQLKRRRKKTFP